MYNDFIDFVRTLYNTKQTIALHAPVFLGNEKKYVMDAIDSTFVSSVGEYVTQFEKSLAAFVGSHYAVATVNGTSALHIALKLLGVSANDEVITQPFSFVASCNAIRYCGADPLFIDIDDSRLGLSAEKLERFLCEQTEIQENFCINQKTRKIIRACVPMHTFGHPVEIKKIVALCEKYCIPVVEDAAEALGSYYLNQHLGTFGKIGIFSFNGNKILTTGGGGMLVTDDEALARRAKHLTTTAKKSHVWDYFHDELGFNYRMPNLNAALGLAQLEQLPKFLKSKRKLAEQYHQFFKSKSVEFFLEKKDCRTNYWLNAVFLKNENERNHFLKITNEKGVMTRPAWALMSTLPMYQNCYQDDLTNATALAKRLVNIPSGVIA